MLSSTRLAILGHMATVDFLGKVNKAAEDTSPPDDAIERFEFFVKLTMLAIENRTMSAELAEELAAAIVACVSSGESLRIATDIVPNLDIDGSFSDDIDAMMYRDAEKILYDLDYKLKKIQTHGIDPLVENNARVIYDIAIRLIAYVIATQK